MNLFNLASKDYVDGELFFLGLIVAKDQQEIAKLKTEQRILIATNMALHKRINKLIERTCGSLESFEED